MHKLCYVSIIPESSSLPSSFFYMQKFFPPYSMGREDANVQSSYIPKEMSGNNEV